MEANPNATSIERGRVDDRILEDLLARISSQKVDGGKGSDVWAQKNGN
jgi:hypothetical protein